MKKSVKNIIFIVVAVVLTIFFVTTGKLSNNVVTTGDIFRAEEMKNR